MGSAASTAIPRAVVHAAGAGENGDIRRNSQHKDLQPTAYPGEVTTCYEGFRRGVRVSGERPCMGYRPVVSTKEVTSKDGKKSTETEVGDFQWMTYNQVAAIIDNIGSAIVHLDLAPPAAPAEGSTTPGPRMIAIFSKNRWEWAVAQQACFRAKAASVPLYDTLGPEAAAFIIQQTAVKTMFCSKIETPKVFAYKRAQPAAFASLTHLIQFEDVTEAHTKEAAELGITLHSFAQMQEVGKANAKPATPPAPEDYAVVCYTSGTTGNPKGAILTHRNMIADASGANFANLGINQNDIHLSYLPLAHSFEQLVENALWMEGAAIGFYQGDTLKILEDIKALRPTIFPSVPRLFNRIYDKIMGGVREAGGLKATLFNQAFESKRYYLANGGSVTHSTWDPIVFNGIRARVGLDRCRLMVSGSAPLASHVLEFLRIAFACIVVEGYGQTECSGASTVQNVSDMTTIGHVGVPLPCNEVKLVSVPDLSYLVTDTVHGRETDKTGKVVAEGIPCEGRGEICYRGFNVFPGYYKDAEKTAEALDAEGWLHSGDIGLWTKDGYLKIIDRKKNMFKLSQGEYVAAEKVENVLLSEWAQQIFVYGDSLHSVLLAFIVPNPDTVRSWARDNGKGDLPFADVVRCKELNDLIKADLVTRGKAAKLQSFEIPKAVHLDPEPWTPETILTPTFKLKRADAKRKYQAQIDAMYAAVDAVAGKTDVRQGDVKA